MVNGGEPLTIFRKGSILGVYNIYEIFIKFAFVQCIDFYIDLIVTFSRTNVFITVDM